MDTLHTILAAWPIWGPIVAVLLASLVTRLTPYPRAAGVVTALRVVLDVLSVLTHRDSPGTWQLPLVQRSSPPPGPVPAAAPEVPPAAWLVGLLGVGVAGCDAIDGPSTSTTVLLLAWGCGLWLGFLSLRRLWRLYQTMRVWTLWVALAVMLSAGAAGCGATTKQIAATATIATVQTIDEGLVQFAAWSTNEEDAIAEAALRACQGKPKYNACTSAIVTPRRAPIDKAKAAIRLYRAALAGGEKLAQGDLAITAQSVVEALAAVGIRVVAGGAR